MAILSPTHTGSEVSNLCGQCGVVHFGFCGWTSGGQSVTEVNKWAW